MGRKHELVSIAEVGRTYSTTGRADRHLAVSDLGQVFDALMLGVDQPVSGQLTAGMALMPGYPVPLEQLIHSQAKPEIAIVLSRELRPDHQRHHRVARG